MKVITLVALQFAFIGIILIGTSFSNFIMVGWFPFFVSIIIFIWALMVMKNSVIKIFPEPSAKATLVINGPYKFIRHPMYTAVLLACSGLVIGHFTILRAIFLLGLTIVLVVKLLWEEKMLLEKFQEYKGYMNRTKKIIPFIY